MKTINQSIILNASPKEVYGVLMDSKKHSKLTGDTAVISKKEGGKFSAWGGYITGTNIKLEEGRKIVQKWTCSDFPVGHYSELIFELEKQGNKTKLILKHKNVPDENYEDISQGWKDYYFEPLKEMFN